MHLFSVRARVGFLNTRRQRAGPGPLPRLSQKSAGDRVCTLGVLSVLVRNKFAASRCEMEARQTWPACAPAQCVRASKVCRCSARAA